MPVSYKILDWNKNVLAIRSNQACFSEFPYLQADWFDNIGYILYKVRPHGDLSTENTRAFLSLLKSIGFPIVQTPEEVLDKGFMLSLEQCKCNGGIRVPLVGGTLTVVRYLEEFTKTVANALNILNINPSMNPWDVLRLAHLCQTQGPLRSTQWYGFGHCLFTFPHLGGNPQKPWDKVQEDLAKAPIWSPNFGNWRINITFGTNNNYRSIHNIKQHIIKDEQSLTEALKWLN